jgi:hypothetical protein
VCGDNLGFLMGSAGDELSRILEVLFEEGRRNQCGG